MKKIYITGQEVKEHLELYKRGSALSSVKKILENPKRLSELGFSLEQFKQIDEDIKQVNVDYINWCKKMEEKYQIYFTGNILSFCWLICKCMKRGEITLPFLLKHL